jgi:hypothetical protein
VGRGRRAEGGDEFIGIDLGVVSGRSWWKVEGRKGYGDAVSNYDGELWRWGTVMMKDYRNAG